MFKISWIGFSLIFFQLSSQIQAQDEMIELSQNFLKALKEGESTSIYKEKLASLSLDELAVQIHSDDKRKAFWINIYNAYIQDILNDNPDLYMNRSAFFKDKQITIAGRQVSFDDIEHGIIRRSSSKFSLGYLRKWNVSKFEKKLRMDKRDGRIHFALNCGARSCPAVAIYDDRYINKQLDKISKQFLTKTSSYQKEKNLVQVTALISWFRGDFGGLDGAKELLKRYEVIENTRVSLEFKNYDWTLFLDNYTEI